MRVISRIENPNQLTGDMFPRTSTCLFCGLVAELDVSDVRLSQQRTSDMRGGKCVEDAFSWSCPDCKHSNVLYFSSNERIKVLSAIRFINSRKERY